MTRGRQLFKENCAVCHNYSDDPSLELKGPFKAPDLAGWASEKWVRGLLEKPGSDSFFGLTKLTGMKKWRRNIDEARAEWKAKDDPKVYEKKVADQDAEFILLARFLADQAKPKAKRDAKLSEDGKKVFFARKAGACSKCHSIDGKGNSDGPDFTDYGSQEWIRVMVMSPANPRRFASNNQMPALRNLEGPGADVHALEFKEANPGVPVVQLSDIDRELIIRWLTKDFRVVFGGETISGPPK